MARGFPRRRRGGSPEHELQVAVFRWWRQNVREPRIDPKTLAVLAEGDAFLYAVPNGGKRDIVTAAKLQDEGQRSGVADMVLMLRDGRSVYIETKTPDSLITSKGYQSREQKVFEATCRLLGFQYRVCRSLEDMAAILDEFGVPYLVRPITPALLRPRPPAGRRAARARPPREPSQPA